MTETRQTCPYCHKALKKTPKRKTICPYCKKTIYVRAGKLLTEAEVARLENTKGETKPKPKDSAAAAAKKDARPSRKTGKGASTKERSWPARQKSPGEAVAVASPSKKSYAKPTLKDQADKEAKPPVQASQGSRRKAKTGQKKAKAAGAQAGSKPTTAEKKGLKKLEDDLAKFAGEMYEKVELDEGKKKLLKIVGALALGGVVLTAVTSIVPPAGLTVGSSTMMAIMIKVAKAYLGMDEKERKQLRAVVNWLKNGFNLKGKLL